MLLTSFRAKVTAAFLLCLLLVVSISNYFVYRFSLDAQFHQIQERLKTIAQTAALLIDGDEIAQIPLDKEGIRSPFYEKALATLQRVKASNTGLTYIYILAPTSSPQTARFVVDADPVHQDSLRNKITSYPGDLYDMSRVPAMQQGFKQPTVDSQMITDAWGTTLSGYAPIFDRQGQGIALLGVDMSASDIFLLQKQVRQRVVFVFIFGVLLSLLLGWGVSSRMTRRIRVLAEGTHRLAQEDLTYRVDEQGHDEIGQLAHALNHLASCLAASRRKLDHYFFQVVQSLIKLLEAKDQYTFGHSSRVAEYAQTIALEMGLSTEKAETLSRATQLHDIGKMHIGKEILNKPGALTPEEWDIIKKHPVVGEESVKPIFVDQEMVTVVRSHHERYDGTGYPDGLSAGEIGLFAQIVSVADAYDAMTSSRAYRQAMTQGEAIAELKKHTPGQFHPQVVDAFLRALEKTQQLFNNSPS